MKIEKGQKEKDQLTKLKAGAMMTDRLETTDLDHLEKETMKMTELKNETLQQ